VEFKAQNLIAKIEKVLEEFIGKADTENNRTMIARRVYAIDPSAMDFDLVEQAIEAVFGPLGTSLLIPSMQKDLN